MVPKKILRNFQAPHMQEALTAGFDFAQRKMNWSVKDRAQMYQLADLAFGPSPNFEVFCHLYDWKVGYWGIGRNGALATAKEVFAMLIDGCSETSRHSGINLLNVDKRAIQGAVRAMNNVKVNKNEYPHMAASKFLHFYNPSLFPIYDNAVMWNEVLHRAFRTEWKHVCGDHGINVTEGSENFLITYFSWAAEVMGAADLAIMIEFQLQFDQLGQQEAVLHGGKKSYYATAFEYALIGAAKLQDAA